MRIAVPKHPDVSPERWLHDPKEHRHDREFGHCGPRQRGPSRELPRVLLTKVHYISGVLSTETLYGVIEVLNIDGWTSPFGPPSVSGQLGSELSSDWSRGM